jgi:magnesium-transporting ATPase (P-type)
VLSLLLLWCRGSFLCRSDRLFKASVVLCCSVLHFSFACLYLSPLFPSFLSLSLPFSPRSLVYSPHISFSSPSHLAPQMAMAVNMALMSLMKTGIFCTEPVRVPLAGKVSHCLFDKTGTLTTDQLVPVGVINASDHISSSSSSSSSSSAPVPPLSDVCQATGETAMVLAACHSLVVVQDDAPAATASGRTQHRSLVMPSSTVLKSSLQSAEESAKRSDYCHRISSDSLFQHPILLLLLNVFSSPCHGSFEVVLMF